MVSIEEMKNKRFQFLNKLYEISEGNQDRIMYMQVIGEELNFDKDLTRKIAQYLKGEGLIQFMSIGGGLSITHYGVVQIEKALSNPDTSTQYFPPVFNTISIGNMVNSQIQQASNDSQQMMITIDEQKVEKLKIVIEELRNSIDELELGREGKKDLEADISTLEAQIESSNPKKIIVDECLKSIRNILASATGGLLASSLVETITTYLAV